MVHLDYAKNVPSGFWKNSRFLWSILSFLAKNSGFWTFFRINTSDLSKTWSETGNSCFELFNDSVGSGKILFSPFWVKNTLHVVTYGFGLFLVILFQTVDVFFLLNFVIYTSLLFKNGQSKLLFWQKNGHFRSKIRFWTLLETAHKICLKLDKSLGTIANDLMVLSCLGKLWWLFLDQIYIAYGDVWCWAFLAILFHIVDFFVLWFFSFWPPPRDHSIARLVNQYFFLKKVRIHHPT